MGPPNSIQEDSIRVSDGLKGSFVMTGSTQFTAFDLMTYRVYRGAIDDWKANTSMADGAFFAEAVPIPSNTLIVRTFSDTVREYVLARKTKSLTSLERKTGLLEKQIDGLFCLMVCCTTTKKPIRWSMSIFTAISF
ncbi:MAG: hypothetical protein U5K54_25745 [Cytophagales bacterium]|nr:hypothetical protein [Cytophagales bacterium]